MRPRRLALWAPLVLALASGPGARADASKKPEDAAAPPAEIKTNSGPQTSAGGRITVEKPTVDAGDVVRGKPAMAVFEIKNTGTGILKIISAKPGWGCTVASFDEAIPPGKVGKVTAQVHTDSYRGPVEKEITVTSDDPTNPVTALHIKANIVGSIEILPRAFLTLPAPPDNDYDAKILVRKEKSEKGELDITDATSSVPWLIVKTRKVDKAEPPTAELPAAEPGDYVVELSVPDESALVQSGQQVRFKTGLPREPQTAIPVSIVMQQAITASPPSLVMMALDNAKETSGEFVVTLRQNLASQPVTTSVTPQAFSVKLEPDGPRRYKAKVGWKWEGESPERLGWVTVMVAGESVRVPVRVRDKPFAKLPPGQPAPEAVPAPANGDTLTAPDTPPGAAAQKPH